MDTAIKHRVPDRVKPSFVIVDTRGLWRSSRAPECPDVKNYRWRLNPVWRTIFIAVPIWHQWAWKGLKVAVAIVRPSMRRPSVKVGRWASKVTRNRPVDSNGSMRLPIMFIWVRSLSCVLVQTTGLSKRLNVSMKNWQSSRSRRPASTKNARPFVSIRGSSYITAAATHHAMIGALSRQHHSFTNALLSAERKLCRQLVTTFCPASSLSRASHLTSTSDSTAAV